MAQKTKIEADIRLSQLDQLQRNASLTLRLSAERDCLINHGVEGWNDFLLRQDRRKSKNRLRRRG